MANTLLLLVVVVGCAYAAVITTTATSSAKNAKCGKNAEFRECTNVCPQKSCQNYQLVSACFSLRCGQPACMCKEGHVLLTSADPNKGCVPRETCSKLQKLKEAEENLAKLPQPQH